MQADSFRAASEAAEFWLVAVSLVADLGRRGSVDAAYQRLCVGHRSLQDDHARHASTLFEASDELAALSDAPVTWRPGRGLSGIVADRRHVLPRVCSFAHEAAAGITQLALALLVSPLAGITDPDAQQAEAERLLTAGWAAVTLSAEEVAVLQERIRRERAKRLLAWAAEAEKPSGPPDPLKENPFRKKNVNTRRVAQMMKEPDSLNWTCGRWAKELDCSPPSVIATDAWKKNQEAQGKMKAERERWRRTGGIGRKAREATSSRLPNGYA